MKNRKSKPHTKLGIAATQKAALSRTRLPRSILESAKAAGCSAFKANGRVDCDELLEFVSKMPKQNADADFYVEKTLDMKATRLLKEQRFQEREKLLWPIEAIKREWGSYVIACKAKFNAAANTVAVEAGIKLTLTPNQITVLRDIISKHHHAALKELREGSWG